MDLPCLESLHALLDQKPADALIGSGPDDRQLGDVPVGDPPLAAVDDPVVSISPGPRRHPSGVRPKLRLGEPKAANDFARGHLGQPRLLLFFRAVSMDRKHTKRPLDGDKAAQPAVTALEFLACQAIHDVAHAGGAIAVQVHTKETQPSKRRNDLHGEGGSFVVFGHDRKEALVDKPSYRRSNQPLLFGEEIVDAQEVNYFRQGELILRTIWQRFL